MKGIEKVVKGMFMRLFLWSEAEMFASRILTQALLFTYVSAHQVINLSRNDWILQNLPLNISVPGSVPSQVHLDLYANQVIGDPSVLESDVLYSSPLSRGPDTTG